MMFIAACIVLKVKCEKNKGINFVKSQQDWHTIWEFIKNQVDFLTETPLRWKITDRHEKV